MSVAPTTLVLVLYALASVVTFVAFARDKRAAVRGRRRTSEATLHALELAGGFPGARLAIALVRHKSAEPAFLAVTAAIALAHAAAWWLAGAA